jgi:hypothetical protein
LESSCKSLSACRSVCLFICLPVYLSACLSVYLPTYLPTYLSAYLSVCLSISLPACLSVYLPICLSVLKAKVYSVNGLVLANLDMQSRYEQFMLSDCQNGHFLTRNQSHSNCSLFCSLCLFVPFTLHIALFLFPPFVRRCILLLLLFILLLLSIIIPIIIEIIMIIIVVC